MDSDTYAYFWFAPSWVKNVPKPYMVGSAAVYIKGYDGGPPGIYEVNYSSRQVPAKIPFQLEEYLQNLGLSQCRGKGCSETSPSEYRATWLSREGQDIRERVEVLIQPNKNGISFVRVRRVWCLPSYYACGMGFYGLDS